MNTGWRLMSLAISGLAGAAASGAVGQVWEKGLGKKKPKDDDDLLDLPLREIVVFTAVTSVVSALVTTLLKRKTAQWHGRRVASSSNI